MIYHGFRGKTEVHFKDLAEVEPRLPKVRETYRAKKQGATQEQIEDLNTKLSIWCEQNFGKNRFNKDWFDLFGTHDSDAPRSIARWDEWIQSKPLSYRRLYYDSLVVLACIQSEEE